MRTFFAALAAVVVIGTTPALGQQAYSDGQTYQLAAGGAVEISATKGDFDGGIDVHVVGSNRADVVVKRTLHNLPPQDVTTSIRRNGDTLEIDTAFHGDVPHSGRIFGFFGTVDSGHYGVSYEISVPARVGVTLGLGNGNAVIEGVAGAIGGETSNGNLTIKAASGPIHASTNNGNIRATIAASKTAPSIRLSTNNGNIDVSVPAGFGAPVSASVNNGNVTNPFATAKGPGGVSLSTNNGNITIKRI